MAMNYETPGVEKIEFEDNTFVTTDPNRDRNKKLNEYIESRGGIIKSSVTKKTNYLIYRYGVAETTKYLKALELVQEKGLEINILPESLFRILSTGKGVVEFGTFPFEQDGLKKPIKWNILKKEEGKALLLSAYGLAPKSFNEKNIDISWKDCTLREWLNDNFYNTAFSDEEKKQIHMTVIQNANHTQNDIPVNNDAEDRIFLLSSDEVRRYLTGFERELDLTPYVQETMGRSSHCRWWLRSQRYDSLKDMADIVRNDRFEQYNDDYVINCNIVRPALWINVESEM